MRRQSALKKFINLGIWYSCQVLIFTFKNNNIQTISNSLWVIEKWISKCFFFIPKLTIVKWQLLRLDLCISTKHCIEHQDFKYTMFLILKISNRMNIFLTWKTLNLHVFVLKIQFSKLMENGSLYTELPSFTYTFYWL